MKDVTTVPGAEHYREIAGILREAARSCQFAGARKEILHLAEALRAAPTILNGGQDRRQRRASYEWEHSEDKLGRAARALKAHFRRSAGAIKGRWNGLSSDRAGAT